MRNSPTYLLMALMSLIFASCAQEELDPSFVYNLDTEFDIRPTHILSPSGSQIGIAITAIDPDICDQSLIIYNQSFVNGISIINISEVINPSMCMTSDFDPAIVVDIASSATNIPLNITIQESIVNSGNLLINSAGAELSMATDNGITITHPQLLHMPQDIIWGGVIEVGAHSAAAESFMDSFIQMSDQRVLDNGYYGHFKLTDTECHIFSTSPHTWYHSDVIGSGHDWGDFIALAAKFENDYPGLKIKLYNSDGYTY